MTIDFARHLLAIEVATRREVEVALLRGQKQGGAFLLELLEQRRGIEPDLERELVRWGGSEVVSLAEADPALPASLPASMCPRLLALPLGVDERGTVVVAAADPLDVHVATEFAYHLQRSVRLVRASLEDLAALLGAPSWSMGPETARQDAEHMNQSPAPSSRMGRDSLPPIPLVRQPPVRSAAASSPGAPATERGVAPEQRRFSLPPIGGFAPVGSSASVLGVPVSAPSPSMERGESSAAAISPVARSADLLHPAAFKMSIEASARSDVARALGDLAVAETPEQVVTAIALGMASSCEEAIVFAVRAEHFTSRVRLNYAGQPEEFSELEVRRDRPSALGAALEQGQVLTQPTPEDLLLFVGQPGVVCATRIDVLERPAIVLLCGGFLSSLEASRTADRLGRAAADALTRILRTRKQ